MRRVDAVRLARSALLLGFGLLIAKLLITGQMRLYMSPNLDPLMASTAGLLAFMGGVELKEAVRATAGARTRGDLDLVLSLGLVAVPLLIGSVVSPRALDSAALGGVPVLRIVLAFAPGPGPVGAPPVPTRPIGDVPDLLGYLSQAGENGVGQSLRVRGLVARDDALAANEFVLLRYRIVHCVADAQPLGLLVVGAHENTWRADQWVEVEGTLASQQRGSERLVSINAVRMVASDEPNDPYVQLF